MTVAPVNETPRPSPALYPGGTAVTRLRVYSGVSVDGLEGGTPHLHTASTEGYVVISGRGALQTITASGFREAELEPGTVVWFTPGTVHRVINRGDLDILCVMANAGLPEAGDAVMTFPDEILADPESYRRAAALPDQASDAELYAAVHARRDLGVTGFVALREAVAAGDFTALDRLHERAARLVRPRLPDWRAAWDRTVAAETRATDAALAHLADGHSPHLAEAVVREARARSGAPRFGMCGRLSTYQFAVPLPDAAEANPGDAVTVNVAVIGIHGHGLSHVLRAQELTRLGSATLVAVADPRPAAPGTLDANVPQFDSLADLLAGIDVAVDVVVICTPIHTHFDLARLALEAGADVLLEKPPVTSVDDFAALAGIIRATGRRVQVGFQSLGSHAIASIRETVLRGDVGTVTGVAASGTWTRTREYWNRAAWAGKRVLNGIEVVDGVVTNPFAHAVATALCLADVSRARDVASVELDQFRANEIECDDTSVVRIRTATGLPVTLGLTLCAAEQSEPSVTVQGTTGRIVFYYTLDLVQVFRDGRSEPVTTTYGRTPLLDDLLRVRGGEGAGLVADFSETEAFTVVLDAVRLAADPRPIPAEFVDWVGSGSDAHPVIRGIDDAIARAGREHKTFAELGLPWARAGAGALRATGLVAAAG